MIRKSMMKLGVTTALGATLAVTSGVFAQQKEMKVVPCDGGEPVTVAGFEAGERLSKDQAQKLADTLMEGWLARQDPAVAVAWVRERDAALAVAAPTAGPSQAQSMQSSDITPRDLVMWEREVGREIAYGDKLFHDDKLIGGLEGVSCAMCHPNASNTHPETYPKFQVQLKRSALLRDMINWCIENPVRGPKLAADDPKMRALEAYILAQRKGVPLEYGKH